MTELTLSIFDPNTLLPHRAGIAGLALALSVINPDDVPFLWKVTEETVKLSWNCCDREAVLSLLKQTYRIQDGYLDVPVLNLDQQGKYTFTQGVIGVFLQHTQQRQLSDSKMTKAFQIDEGQPEILINFKPVLDCYYTRDFKDVFNGKGKFKNNISVKGQHLPGLVECFVHGAYQESPKGFLSLLFLPLACSYYQLFFVKHPDPKKKSLVPTYAIAIPEVNNLIAWTKRRSQFSAVSYKDFRSSGAGESGLRLLLKEKLLDTLESFRVKYCEVYQIGPQQWDKQQTALKQSVYRVKATDEVLNLYDSAFQFFKPQVRQNEKGETWWSESKILSWLCDNLITGRPWYSGFYEFYKRNELYERKGLSSMSQYLDTLEQTFFDTVQGAFSSFLREQILQAQKQGRKLDYKQVTDKVINRLQRPSTQQDFAKTMVDFLSRYRSKATRGVGAEIYQWLHKDNNWKQARDLALLAIASYTGKGKDGKPEIPEEVLDESDSQIDSEEIFELSPM